MPSLSTHRWVYWEHTRGSHVLRRRAPRLQRLPSRALPAKTGGWRMVEESGGEWRRAEESGGERRRVEESGGEWRRVEESGEEALGCRKKHPPRAQEGEESEAAVCPSLSTESSLKHSGIALFQYGTRHPGLAYPAPPPPRVTPVYPTPHRLPNLHSPEANPPQPRSPTPPTTPRVLPTPPIPAAIVAHQIECETPLRYRVRAASPSALQLNGGHP